MLLGLSPARSESAAHRAVISSAWHLMLALCIGSVWVQSLLASPQKAPTGQVAQTVDAPPDSVIRGTQTAPSADTHRRSPAERANGARTLGRSTQAGTDDRLPPPTRHATVPAKVRRYAATVIKRHDADGDGRLQPKEWAQMKGNPFPADLDDDGEITLEEFGVHVAQYARQRSLRLMPFGPTVFVRAAEADAGQGGTDSDRSPLAVDRRAVDGGDPEGRVPRARRFFVAEARLPGGLPQWFLDQDANGDAQVTMSEFAGEWTVSEAAEFRRLDIDGDGVITPREYVAAQSNANTTEGKPAEGAATQQPQEETQPPQP